MKNEKETWIICRHGDYETNIKRMEGTEQDVKRYILRCIRNDIHDYDTECLYAAKTVNDIQDNQGYLHAEVHFDMECNIEIISYSAILLVNAETVEYKSIDLTTLLSEDDEIATYVTSANCYVKRQVIISKNSSDIGQALENTLHRLLEFGANDADLLEIMGALKVEEFMNEDDYIPIDLGYVIQGQIISFDR